MPGLIQKIFNPWVLLGAVLSALLLVVLSLFLLEQTRPTATQPGQPTAVIVEIPAPTSTIEAIATAPFTPTPTLEIPPSPPPGVLALGALVQITGTGGDGLNLRATPGLDGKVQYLGFEAEVFEVTEGPQEVDGLTWWYVVGFSDQTRSGWAAANFLEVIQTP